MAANRSQQIAERAQGDGQAISLSNLQITTGYLDPDYQLIQHHELTRGETGLLRVFSLIPKTNAKESFEARVDDGGPGRRRQPELDIDIKGAGRAAERDFKSSRNGYIGHHNNRSPDPDRRIYDVEIATPAGKVFEGEVAFSVTFSVAASMSATSTLSADAGIRRASFFERNKLFGALHQTLRKFF